MTLRSYQDRSDKLPVEPLTLCLHMQDAVTGGWFRVGASKSGGPNLPVIAATISEIALGMDFLHSKGIVHGDLSSGALLLSYDVI
jgi:tRNA A-37 threonylcarbamoyl transferase component Bud32